MTLHNRLFYTIYISLLHIGYATAQSCAPEERRIDEVISAKSTLNRLGGSGALFVYDDHKRALKNNFKEDFVGLGDSTKYTQSLSYVENILRKQLTPTQRANYTHAFLELTLIYEYKLCLEQRGPLSPQISRNSGQKGVGSSENREKNPLIRETQDAIDLGRTQQAKMDSVSKGKKRSHDKSAEANHCVGIDDSAANLFGSILNICNQKVNVSWCAYRPEKGAWSEFHDCNKIGKGGGQLSSVPPKGRSAAHIKRAEQFYYFACAEPAFPFDAEFIEGRGLQGRCRSL